MKAEGLSSKYKNSGGETLVRVRGETKPRQGSSEH